MLVLGWWRRRRDRRVVAWLRTPEGRAYLREQDTATVAGDGSISTSAAGLIAQYLENEDEG